ncbi:MAG TPA: hypothetical protein VFB84_08745 [Micromonosporaceae bacterium]|nr:hypothetical protein [Micromonosporaceae bacterium]
MGFETERPAIFRRANKTEESYLVLMHYMAGVLWARGAGVEAMNALTKVLTRATRQAPDSAAQPLEDTAP